MGLIGVDAGRLADLTDPRWPISLGFLLQAVAMYYLSLTSLETSAVWLTIVVVLYRLSFCCVHSPLTAVVLKALPPDRLSMGSGLDGIHRGFASTFSIALGSTMLERRLTEHEIAMGEEHKALTASVGETLSAVRETLALSGGGEAALAVVWEHLRQQAQIVAYQDTFLIVYGLTLLAIAPAGLTRQQPTHASRQTQSSGL
jgi:hypothetical protein